MAPDKYNAYPIKTQKKGAPLNSVAPTVKNVMNAFEAIHRSGDFLSISTGGHIPGNRYTTGRTHFQGIQRLQNSNYLVLTGGDDKLGCGQLFLARLDSRNSESAWRTNLLNNDQLPAGGALDRIVLTLNVNDDAHGVDSRLWHVGGISSSGDILAAPVESPDGGSVILFYNFQIPEQPTLLPQRFRIKRPHAMTGGVAMTDLPGGHTLVAALGKHDDGEHYLDCYLTKQPDWAGAFTLIESIELADDLADLPGCQNINFIKSTSGELYMIATDSKVVAPVLNTDDSVRLYKIKFLGRKLSEVTPTDSTAIKITKCGPTRKFDNKVIGPPDRKFTSYQSNMSAAAGVYIHPQGALFIYSSYHWRDARDKSRIRFSEFRPDPEAFTPNRIQSVHDCWVDMFVDSKFRNIRLGLNGASDTAIAEFQDTAAQGHIFGKKLSSLRCQIPPDKKLVLYSRKNFNTSHRFKEINGTGKLISIPDLKKMKFGDKTRSCRIIPIDQPA